jgi:hypothetical protein
MAGFRKARAEQAALKLGIYGPAGSGKTFTSLLIAEGIARLTGKRVAMVDTEHGSDFYCQSVPTRPVHPDAFDFDALYTRSITETVEAVRSLDPATHSIVVLDSMTHLWQACLEAYTGGKTSAGTIPMHAWGKIKKPYRDLMSHLLSSTLHVIICGRQGTEYATDEETDELRAVGVKMKAEGETPYEPHILIRMETLKPKHTNELAMYVAYAEKDRTGVLAGRSFINPTFETLCKPLLGLLGATQAQLDTLDQAALKDADALAAEHEARVRHSSDLLREWTSKVNLAASYEALRDVGDLITPQLKAQMLPEHVGMLREAYQERERQLPKPKKSRREAA